MKRLDKYAPLSFEHRSFSVGTELLTEFLLRRNRGADKFSLLADSVRRLPSLSQVGSYSRAPFIFAETAKTHSAAELF